MPSTSSLKKSTLVTLFALAAAGQANALSAEAAGSASVAPSPAIDSLKQQLDAVHQKVLILERLRDNDQEAAKAASEKTGKALADGKGFTLVSQDDKSFSLKLKGFVQSVGSVYLDDGEKKQFTNNFTARRVQTHFDGVLYKDFSFRVHSDFAGSAFVLLDSYLDWAFLPEVGLRVGKFKVPTNLERLQASPRGQFIEAGYTSALLPNRDLGIQLQGLVGEGLFEYQLGLFNGVSDAASGVDDVNDDKDAWVRVFISPFANTSIYFLQGLGLGISGSQGYHQKGTLPTYRTPNRKTFFSYLAADTAQGKVTRYNPQASYYNGAFSVNGDFASTTQKLRKSGIDPEELTHTAWSVVASWVLTGEAQSYRGLKVKNAVNDSGIGAIELLGRVGGFNADEKAFERNRWADTARSAKSAFGYTIGLNWYLNNAVRLQLNYEHNLFDSGLTKTTGTGAARRVELIDQDDEKVVSLSFNVAY
jgi:phosphate-selective porin OprO and OprP